MTLTQATYLATNFEVISSINTNDFSGSGFDAVVWRGRAGADYAGKVFASMRGTEPGQDLFITDADLAFTGKARFQVIDMVNWWFRETGAAGEPVRQITLAYPVPFGPTFAEAAVAVGTGRITTADLVSGIEVNGHSLGGYLASAITRLFGSQAHVQHTSTFNSAGFAYGGEAAFTELQNLVGVSYGIGHFPDISEQTNYFAKNGLNLTTNNTWFTQAGNRVELFNESDITQIGNHFMYKLTDALALGVALEKLDATLTKAELNALLDAGSNQTAASIEGILDGLRKVLAGPNVQALPIGDFSDSATSRVTYHATLTDLQDNPIFKDLAGQLNINLSGSDLRATARNDFGALIALQDLSPIYIGGKTTAADAQLGEIWQIARASDYSAWQLDKTMSTADRQQGKETFSDNWYTDRATLLGYVIKRNVVDSEGIIAIAPGVQSTHYEDIASHTQIDLGLPDNVVEKRQTLFGADSNDILQGKKLTDHLYGGAGDDRLPRTKKAKCTCAIKTIAKSISFKRARGRFDPNMRILNVASHSQTSSAVHQTHRHCAG